MPSREASLRNLERAKRNWRAPKPLRCNSESRVIRRLVWQWHHDVFCVCLSQAFNTGGRITQVNSSWVSAQAPATLLSGAQYNAADAPTSYIFGNGLTETYAFNGRLQPCRMNVNSSGTLVTSCTQTLPSGNILDLTLGFGYGAGDNGNVTSFTAAGQQSFNRSYGYDALNRISTMSSPGSTCSGLSW